MAGIYARHFRGAGFVPDKALDDMRSALHRRTRALAAIVSERTVSSAVRAAPLGSHSVGRVTTAHVFWLRDEGAATCRAASSWGAAPLYGPRMTRLAEDEVKARLLRIRSVLRSVEAGTQ